ncbi:hypothetical protein BROUX41_005174 [Berkeleyomyces rouxiae]|uniref:uncharacterized protein n=1 Tax=Berkeleyomyces rouxiae TaxID=2035830 RepID=UPI003B785A69
MAPVNALVATPPAPADTAAADTYEQAHVHAVYESIASHFSATRHKPWPLVCWFLQSRRPGAVGLDLGCGNGKYIGVNPAVVLLGSDRSESLVRLARPRTRFATPAAPAPARKARGNAAIQPSLPPPPAPIPPVTGGDVLVADSLALPFVPGAADFAISIAVVHHFSTRERRRDAVHRILACLRPRNAAAANGVSGPTTTTTTTIDLPDSARLELPEGAVVGERASDEGAAVHAGEALIYVWALEQRSSRRGWDEGAAQDQLVPWVTKSQQAPAGGTGAQVGAEGEAAPQTELDKTVHRYYHLYRKGELEEDVRAVGGEVVRSGYERDNWWVICRRRADFSIHA